VRLLGPVVALPNLMPSGCKSGQNIRKPGRDARCCPCFAAAVLYSSRPSGCTETAVAVVSLKSRGEPQ